MWRHDRHNLGLRGVVSLRSLLCLASLAVLAGFGSGCRSTSPDLEQGQPTSSPQQEDVATVERCGRGFRGQMITPRGKRLQSETAQTKVCVDDDCRILTRGLLSARHFLGSTCDEVHENIKSKPLVDSWGARARVTCNGYAAQAISAGRDGKIGTCDDLGITIEVNAPTFR